MTPALVPFEVVDGLPKLDGSLTDEAIAEVAEEIMFLVLDVFPENAAAIAAAWPRISHEFAHVTIPLYTDFRAGPPPDGGSVT